MTDRGNSGENRWRWRRPFDQPLPKLSKDEQPASQSTSGVPATRSTRSLVGKAQLSVSHTPVATHNSKLQPIAPNTDQHKHVATPAVPSISVLWDEAYDSLQVKESKLMERHEKQINTDSTTLISTSIALAGLGRIAVRDLAKPVVGIVDWAQDYVGSALESSPYGSLAWAGICLLLPLVLKPSKQREANVAGLEEISKVLSRCTIYEIAFMKRFENRPHPLSPDEESELSQRQVRTALKELYTSILKFQAEAVCQLSRNLLAKTAHEMLKLEHWDEWLSEVRNHATECQRVFGALVNKEEVDQREALHQQRVDSIVDKLVNIRDTLQEIHFNEEQQRCFEVLSTSDYASAKNHNPKRSPGTCKWFLDHQKYHEWTAKPPVSRLLWASADPGCGKSVLARTIVDQYDAASVCYYFFKDDDPTSKSASHALCALLHQICRSRPDMVNHVLPAWRVHGKQLKSRFEDLWTAFETIIRDPGLGKVICVLDALDECTDPSPSSQDVVKTRSNSTKAEQRKILLQRLVSLTSSSHSLKVVITSRPYDSIQMALLPQRSVFIKRSHIHLVGEGTAEKEDIRLEILTVINDRIEEIRRKRKLYGFDDDAHVFLKKRLDAVENGIYLWDSAIFAKLELEIGADLGDLEIVIRTLPEDVDEAYEKILEQSADKRSLTAVLRMMLVAQISLASAAVRTALSILHDHSAPFLRLDSNFDEVRRREEAYRKRLRHLCGFYINIRVHERLSSESDSLYYVHQTAKEFLIENFIFEGADLSAAYKRWNDLYESHTRTLTGSTPNPLFIAGERGWSWLTETVHLRNVANLEDLNQVDQTPLCLAVANDHLRIAQRLLGHGASIQTRINRSRQLLSYAQSTSMVDLLIKHGAHLEGRDDEGNTPFIRVIQHRNHIISHHLFGLGVDVLASNYRGNTGLYYAISNRDIEMVTLLLAKGADPNITNVDQETLLHRATAIASIPGSMTEITRLLYDTRADVNQRDDRGKTSLHHAASTANKENLIPLLRAGADVKIRDLKEYSPIHCVVFIRSSRGNSLNKYIELLLKKGFEVNATDIHGRTTLHYTAGKGLFEVVEYLLSVGADYCITDNPGETALDVLEKRLQDPVWPRQSQDDLTKTIKILEDARAATQHMPEYVIS
ncbi:hypothetical protein MMC25_004331 [Agyrium rufum]|nr:hypothetical protein [Agyrium rufum]